MDSAKVKTILLIRKEEVGLLKLKHPAFWLACLGNVFLVVPSKVMVVSFQKMGQMQESNVACYS